MSGSIMSSSSRFMTDFPPHRLLSFTFLGCPCSVYMDWATAMSLKVPSEGCVHRSIYLAMMKGASSPVISLHALCIDAPQICGISGMRIGRCLSEFGRIHFLARRCIGVSDSNLLWVMTVPRRRQANHASTCLHSASYLDTATIRNRRSPSTNDRYPQV